MSSSKKWWRNFNFEKLKSLEGRIFFIIWGASPHRGIIIMVTKGKGGGGGGGMIQVKTFIMFMAYFSSLLSSIIACAITCPFSKYFQILYIFALLFKHVTIFQHFFVLFLKNCVHVLFSRKSNFIVTFKAKIVIENLGKILEKYMLKF